MNVQTGKIKNKNRRITKFPNIKEYKTLFHDTVPTACIESVRREEIIEKFQCNYWSTKHPGI